MAMFSFPINLPIVGASKNNLCDVCERHLHHTCCMRVRWYNTCITVCGSIHVCVRVQRTRQLAELAVGRKLIRCFMNAAIVWMYQCLSTANSHFLIFNISNVKRFGCKRLQLHVFIIIFVIYSFWNVFVFSFVFVLLASQPPVCRLALSGWRSIFFHQYNSHLHSTLYCIGDLLLFKRPVYADVFVELFLVLLLL